MVEDLGLPSLGLRDQSIVEDIEDVLADLLEFCLNLLTVITDGGNVLVGTFGLFLLLDGRDDAPGRPSRANDILVCNREEVSFVDGQLTTKLPYC